MKKFLILTLLAFVPLVHGAGIPITEPSSDAIIFGVASSSDSKEIEFNTGDAGSNVKLTVDDSRNVVLNTNQLTLGDGAATDKKIIFNIGGSNPEIRWNNADSKIQFSNDGVTFKNVGSGAGGGGGINMLAEDNADFESALAGTWTASGGVLAAETSNPLLGAQSANFNASATSQTVSSVSKSLTADGFRGLRGAECVAELWTYYPVGSTGDYQLQVFNGSSVLTQVDIPASQTDIKDIISTEFTCPLTGSLILRVISTADAEDLIFDQAFLGESQLFRGDSSEVVTKAFYDATTSCNWSRTGTLPPATLGTVAACPSITVVHSGIDVNTADDDTNNLVYSGALQPGVYLVRVNGTVRTTSSNPNATIRISDGTDIRGNASSSEDNVDSENPFTVEAVFVYPDGKSGGHTFELFGAASSTAIVIKNDDAGGSGNQTHWTVTRYPLQTSKSRTFDQANKNVTAQWDGATNCLWSGAGGPSSFAADADCNNPTVTGNGAAPGTKIPAVTVNNINANDQYMILVNGGEFRSSTDATACDWFIHDGTNVVGNSVTGQNSTASSGTGSILGVFNYSSFQASRTFEIQYDNSGGANCEINLGVTNRRLTMTVINLTEFRGGINFDNMVSTPDITGRRLFDAELNCSPSSNIVNAPGGWVGSIGNISSGNCAVTFSPVLSATPNCTVTGDDGGGGADVLSYSSKTGSGITIRCETNGAAACTSYDFDILCVGPK